MQRRKSDRSVVAEPLEDRRLLSTSTFLTGVIDQRTLTISHAGTILIKPATGPKSARGGRVRGRRSRAGERVTGRCPLTPLFRAQREGGTAIPGRVDATASA